MLLEMATTNGALAVGVDSGLVDLQPGEVAGLIAVPAVAGETGVEAALLGDMPPQWIIPPEEMV